MTAKETIKRDAPARVLYRAVGALAHPSAPSVPAFPSVTKGMSLGELYDAQTTALLARVLKRSSNCIDVGCQYGVIHVEGAELQVLRGGTGMLRRCRPFVVFKHGLGAADYYGTRPEQVFDLLSDCGLRVSLMKDWLEHGSANAFTRSAFVEEFDSGRNFYYLAHPA